MKHFAGIVSASSTIFKGYTAAQRPYELKARGANAIVHHKHEA